MLLYVHTKMRVDFFIFYVFCFTSCIITLRCAENETVINEYVEYINNRSQAALAYELPTDARMYKATDATVKEYGDFDFIIIGAGSTGCIIANRLSENPQWKVLLIEAGTYRDKDLTGIPALWAQDGFTKFNWGFKTIPQKYACQGNKDRICSSPRGKGIGGTSLINCGFYTRGDRIDYKRWSNLLNDSSWDYEQVLPYFIKLENFTRQNPTVPVDTEYHGYSGYLHTSHCKPPQNLSTQFLKAGQQIGYDIVDFNGRKQEGTSVFQYFIKDGKRFDPGTAFIEPIKNRENLIVLEKSYVTKIEVDNETKKANGVIFTRENKTYIARNRKEVILSAGAISSPQILMLSGIGPKEHLESLEIPVVQNLPVGDNLSDHPLIFFVFSSNITSHSESIQKSVKDLLKGKGTLTRSFIYDALGWFPSKFEPIEGYSSLEIALHNLSDSAITQKLLGYTDETYTALNVTVPNPLAIAMTICHPKSKGTIKLNTSDPFDYPLIDLNHLSNKEDLEMFYEGVKLILKITKTEQFRAMNVTLAFDQFPGCEHTKPLSQDYWYCYFSKVTGTGYHPTSTCSTGTSPENGVVNNELKVFGIEGLRVADASVIPFPLAAHPNAACNMIGEKISALIKNDNCL